MSENGDVRVCFIADSIGNLYETPLSRIWNCQRAMAQRSDMIAGRYLESGCSTRRCSWREGKKAPEPRSDGLAELRAEMMHLADRAAQAQPLVQPGEAPPAIAAVRRVVASRDRHIKELEVMFAQLCEKNAAIHQRSQEHIAHLESKAEAAVAQLHRLEGELTAIHQRSQEHIDHLESKAEGAVAQFHRLEGELAAIHARSQEHIDHLESKAEAAIAGFRRVEREFAHYRELPLIRLADALSRSISGLRRAIFP